MKYLILFCGSALFFSVAGYTSSLPSECFAPSETSCEFYKSCLETVVPCGPKGYALSYGQYYCNKFKRIEPKLSLRGRSWLQTTRQCLQQKLAGDLILRWQLGDLQALQCGEVRSEAYTQHPVCYTELDNSICFLDPIHDLPLILSVYEKRELEKLSDINQARRVVEICLKQDYDGWRGRKNRSFWTQKALEYELWQ